MLISSGLILIGFLLLGAGAELLVSGSSRLALRLGITPLAIGLTIVAFGTSSPELAVSIESTVNDLSALALGNVIGSNIANIGLILGITALVQPIKVQRSLVRMQIPIVIACSALLGIMLVDGSIGLGNGLLLCLGLVLYLWASYRQSKTEFANAEIVDVAELGLPDISTANSSENILRNVMAVIIGLGLLIYGSQLFVDHAVIIARTLGISEALIGLTLVAVGTSIPELATSILAALRKQSDIAIGNVLGSNIFNILCVLGVTALFGPILAAQFSILDFVTLLLFVLILLPLAKSGFTLSRVEGALLLAGYAAYIAILSRQI